MSFFNLDPSKPLTRDELDRQQIEFCWEHHKLVNNWELDFLIGVKGFSRLSLGQRNKLALIREKIDAKIQIREEGSGRR